ncbi:glycosyltransferase [Candidatus Nanohalococcus occultus]|uniref:GDP-Man:Man(1)GlcNAc(2)-PP-Dol alpha-1,3-mannosyltransferase n=1 Tax=Candidatus Nanohalococcus occultus TaxID=2978047 RepID=A0ABY8CFU6_9ARCH|nr:Glycosyltransferase [Candidatus Nanohaloarchaeota archaeon SVXNc]
MRQAIYHPWLKGRGGAEKVILEAAKNSEHETTVFTLFYDEEQTFEEFKDVDIQVIGSNAQPRNFLDKGLRFGLGAMIKKLPLEDYDALIVSEAGIGSLIAIRNHDIPVIGYVHTPLRPALPEFKQTYRAEKSVFTRPIFDIGIKIYDILERQAWKHFDAVLANSQLTKERIVEKGLKKEDEIEVLNPGAELVEETSDLGKYFLYPSRFRRYKRQDLAIEAWKQAETQDFDLVLAGAAQEQDYIQELEGKADSSIKFKYDLPGDQWKEQFKNAYGVLFLAEKEDWGIVPIEAGMYGKPTIAVNEGSPAETVKDRETGFLVEADSADIAEKIEAMIESREKAEFMGQKARENAEKYSWNNFGQKLDGKVKQAAGK